MTKEKSSSPFRITECPSCNGKGRCLVCADAGLLVSWGPWVFAWRLPLTYGVFVEQVVERAVQALLNVAVFLVGAVLLLDVIWYFVEIVSQGDPIVFSADMLSATQQRYVWWSILCFAFFFYRRLMWRDHALSNQLDHLTISRRERNIADHFTKKNVRDLGRYFATSSYRTLARSRFSATQHGSALVTPLHLFDALLADTEVQLVFRRLGIEAKTIRDKVLRGFEKVAVRQSDPDRLSPEALRVLYYSLEEAFATRAKYIQPVHMLSALLRTESYAEEILIDHNVNARKVRDVIRWIDVAASIVAWKHRFRRSAYFKPTTIDRAKTAVQTKYLDRFSRDLTRAATKGHFSTLVGRDREINEVFDAIQQGKTNVVLIGDAGVGKTSILHAIAQKMVMEEVPAIMVDKRFVGLDVSLLAAGAADQGELEERLQIIAGEVARAGNIVVALENIHLLVGLGAAQGQALDLSESLVNILSHHPFVTIATSSRRDYFAVIEKKERLATAMYKVEVDEMTPEQAILVLEAETADYERAYRVYFSYDAIAAIAELSHKYIRTSRLPDKAVSLLDEVALHVRRTKGKRALVTEADVRDVISTKTAIPLSEAGEDEKAKLLNLENILHERIIGQNEAVKVVSAALRRARADVRDTKRPIANFLFIGPTGVGKTELAKALAAEYFGAEENMIRFDMSEYQEQASIERLIGGKSGSGAEAGLLTEAVRLKPFALLLFDELEKAHPDILNLFLQMMDDGRLTDSLGRTSDFTNSIIIATSNAGSPYIAEAVATGKGHEEMKNYLLNEGLREKFRPEFLNRFDDIVVFTPLNEREIEQIAVLLLVRLQKDLEKKGIRFSATKEAVAMLAREGFDPAYGARPLKRAITERVNDALATFMLQEKLGRRDVAILQEDGTIRVEEAESL